MVSILGSSPLNPLWLIGNSTQIDMANLHKFRYLMISDDACFMMFYVSVLTKKKQADSLSGEPWNPLTFLNIVEVVIDEGTRFNSFEPVKTCQNHKRRQNWFPDMRSNSKIFNVYLSDSRNASVPNPILNRRKFKVHAMYIILECPMSILRSISATLHFCPQKWRFTFAWASSSFYENNIARCWCMLYTVYMYVSNKSNTYSIIMAINILQ